MYHVSTAIVRRSKRLRNTPEHVRNRHKRHRKKNFQGQKAFIFVHRNERCGCARTYAIQNRTAQCSVLLQPQDDIDINYQHISTLAVWNSDCIV